MQIISPPNSVEPIRFEIKKKSCDYDDFSVSWLLGDEFKVSECGQLCATDDAYVCKMRNFHQSDLCQIFLPVVFFLFLFLVYCICSVYLYLCSLGHSKLNTCSSDPLAHYNSDLKFRQKIFPHHFFNIPSSCFMIFKQFKIKKSRPLIKLS